ncbi:hypothetical protein CEXT_372601 [Caerostris extrusa]|uniref:Uncharacterized protein n=1 Tax=Caerostris extrusa TaxID=172846 RepID=A0AAV4TSQ3_CAEEX|nr:hypothetical protein CEXT_372601 [Caerostris extrusa]
MCLIKQSSQNGQILHFNALINTLNYPSINLPTELNFNEVTPALVIGIKFSSAQMTSDSVFALPHFTSGCLSPWTSPVSS